MGGTCAVVGATGLGFGSGLGLGGWRGCEGAVGAVAVRPCGVTLVGVTFAMTGNGRCGVTSAEVVDADFDTDSCGGIVATDFEMGGGDSMGMVGIAGIAGIAGISEIVGIAGIAGISGIAGIVEIPGAARRADVES